MSLSLMFPSRCQWTNYWLIRRCRNNSQKMGIIANAEGGKRNSYIPAQSREPIKSSPITSNKRMCAICIYTSLVRVLQNDDYTLKLYQVKQVSGSPKFLRSRHQNDFLASTSGGRESTTCLSLGSEAPHFAQSESTTSTSP
jgi:hypothetical protein